MRLSAIMFLLASMAAHAFAADDQPLFHSTDPLASRDDWGLYHQSPILEPTDFAPRYHWRPLYYLQSRNELAADPAYVGSVQVSLRRWGYYCGPIDGVFSAQVSDAIARMQKGYSMRVTGTLTVPVRRALFLP
ncbi:MAG: peptidoglycan-binding domain-containing protein [Chthoniobacterales bacterium]